jgi:hypothetical protein
MVELEDIYHPRLVYIFNLNSIFSFVLTTIFFFPAIYIVFTQSKKAKLYKYLLINQLCWAYLFEIMYIAEGTILLSPLPAFYFAGICSNHRICDFEFVVPITFFIIIGFSQSYLASLMYRVSYAGVFNKFQEWFQDGRNLVSVLVISFMASAAIIIGKIQRF